MSELLEPGQIFAGRYRIERFLAKGGFGAVYVAEQTETELRVALKVLWAHVLHSKDAVDKFKLEARIAGRVGSDHIVKVLDAGFDDATKMPFLVMELLSGSELEAVIESSGPLPPDRLVMYFRQVASALDKAHGYVDRDGMARPIVHRDLKPENLFLSYRETGEPIVKILDFGIAKVLSDSTKVSQEVKGTPLYMAFEQAMAGRITAQTDIWALGLIGFFLLTGRVYWKTANLAEASLTQLFGEVLSLPIDPPSVRAAEIGAKVIPTPAFDAWFARCVNRETAERFRTAGECAAALSSVFAAPETRLSPGAFQAGAFDATAASLGPPVPGPVPGAAHTGAAPTVRSEDAVEARSGVLGNTTGTASAMSGTASVPVSSANRGLIMAVTAVVAMGAIGVGAATFLKKEPQPEDPPARSAEPSSTTGTLGATPPDRTTTTITAQPTATASALPAPSVAPSVAFVDPPPGNPSHGTTPKPHGPQTPRPPVTALPHVPATTPTVPAKPQGGVYDER